ncbi:MAG: magnesium and cobalt exporter, family [Pseudonocardiales bacterium]|nr:magnesium and cobalt exporter, family [Pseudonocardiales bacterium]MDT4919914.1 magnesium and cobalt exporter, family [Pseudonocardiales bacterium]
MSHTLINVGVVLLLIIIEGIFVGAEIALVSLRESQVRGLAETGRRGQIVARLVSDPNRFLAAVQIGVTSTALLSSAFGAVTLSEDAKNFLVDHGWGKGLAGAVGILGVTLIISFVTLVLGEIAPKRLGLQRAEQAALFFASPVSAVATFFRPVIWLLSKCTDVVVRLLGGDPNAGRTPISEEELRGLVAAHESLTSEERRLIDDVFAAGERSIGEVMVPRTDVTFLEASMTISKAAKVAAESPHSRYPVIGRDQDDVLGFVHIRDLLLPTIRHDRDRTIVSVAREVKALPGSKRVLAAMSEMRREGQHMAIVVDEYGGTDGIVTLEDLIEEVIGDIRDEYDEDIIEARRLAGGEVEVDGKLNLDEIAEISGVELPDGPYATVAGFVMAELGRLPRTGDVVEYDGVQIAVLRTDGRRVARVRLTPRTTRDEAEPR